MAVPVLGVLVLSVPIPTLSRFLGLDNPTAVVPPLPPAVDPGTKVAPDDNVPPGVIKVRRENYCQLFDVVFLSLDERLQQLILTTAA